MTREWTDWRDNKRLFGYIQIFSISIQAHSESYKIIQSHSNWFHYGYLIPIKGNILKVSRFLLSFPKYRSYSLIIKCDNFKKTRIFCFRSQNFQCVIFKIFCDYFDLKWLCEHLNLAYVYGVYAFSIL